MNAALTHQLEHAVAVTLATQVATLTTLSTPATVYGGMGSADKEGPCVIVVAEKGPEDPLRSGNYRLTLKCHVKGLALDVSTGEADFNLLCACVDTVMLTPGAEAIISAAIADSFTIIGVMNDFGYEASIDGDVWVSTHVWEVYCCTAKIGS